MNLTCTEFKGHTFSSQRELFKALVENKTQLLSLKKSAVKFSDTLEYGIVGEFTESGDVIKANNPVNSPDLTELKVRVVMNTTGLLDSHGDVHIKGIWKRTLDHNNIKLHLQEHKRDFNKVISDDAEAYVKTLMWKTLGHTFEGSTQALIFDSVVKESRNPEMFRQYKNAWVKNHSVGMNYGEIFMCINSEEQWSKTYKDNWEKYIGDVANKEDAEQKGYFWAVTEAKLIEGSAVVMGSNWVTPTLDNNMKSDNSSPSFKFDSEDSTQIKESYFSHLITN
jgi:hypothetical protein